MKTGNSPKGVLEATYADERTTKKELAFRFRVRGEAVCWAVKTFMQPSELSDLALLDMGAADGKTLTYMNKRLSLRAGIGIENNPALIAASETLPAKLRLEQGDVTDLACVEDGAVSLVSALALLEHLTDPLLAVQEAARVLKAGGLFVASSPVPFWDHLSVRLGLLAEGHHVCDMHSPFFRSLINKVQSLRLIHFKKFMWAPIGILPYLGTSLSAEQAYALDRSIEKLKMTNWLFVNQLAVAVKE